MTTSFDLERTIELLERTPRTLSALLDGLSDPWTRGDEGEDTFSPRDVVGHLLDGEETDWIPRVELILDRGEDEPFAPFDRFGFREKYEGRTLGELLEKFHEARAESLDRLRARDISEADLDREGSHPALGRVTLRQLLATWAVHDLSHIRQIARVMAKQYQADVGPWEAYLRVLKE